MGKSDACPICGAMRRAAGAGGQVSDRAFRALLSVMALGVLAVMAWTLWPEGALVATPAPTVTPVPRMARAAVPTMTPLLTPKAAVTASSTPPARVPATPTPTPTAVEPTPTTVMRVHVVASGEHLGVIAEEYGLDESTIARANGIGTETILQIGQELVIPPVTTAPYTFPTQEPTRLPTVAPTMMPSATPIGGVVVHVVSTGDNLGSLAARYRVETRDIAEANDIPLGTILAIGQELVIPGILPTPTALPMPVPTHTLDMAMVAAISPPTIASRNLEKVEAVEGTGQTMPTLVDVQLSVAMPVSSSGALDLEADSMDGEGLAAPPTRPTATASLTATPSPTATSSPMPTPTTIIHVVASGDNLGAIAFAYDVEVAEITRANGLTTDTVLQVGQGLTIPCSLVGMPVSDTMSLSMTFTLTTTRSMTPTATTVATQAPILTATTFVTHTATPTATVGPVVHVVASGDTIGAIAVQYDVASQDILAANNLGSRAILRIGQEIIIPGAEPTVTPTQTATPTPTATPTVRMLLRLTPRPTSAFPYGSPRLLAPINDVVVMGADTRIVLNWASVGILDEDEWYAVRLWAPDAGDEPMTVWTKATSWRLPGELCAEGGGLFEWQVTVYTRESETDRGAPASRPSVRYRFTWQ